LAWSQVGQPAVSTGNRSEFADYFALVQHVHGPAGVVGERLLRVDAEDLVEFASTF
jgi:hypothetical protein